MQEYALLVAIDIKVLQERLNALGAAGWELVYINSHFISYQPLQPGEGRAGGGPAGGPAENGYVQWNAAMKRSKVGPDWNKAPPQ